MIWRFAAVGIDLAFTFAFAGPCTQQGVRFLKNVVIGKFDRFRLKCQVVKRSFIDTFQQKLMWFYCRGQYCLLFLLVQLQTSIHNEKKLC